MRALLAAALILGGVLLLSACATGEEEGEGPTATGTPTATTGVTRTPGGAAISPTPRRDLVQRPDLPSPQPTATPVPGQTVGPQPTVVSQPTVVPQPTVEPPPTVEPQPTIEPQPTVVPQPTVLPSSEPPPTVVRTPFPTPTPTPAPTPTPKPAPTGPIVFRGWVVGAPDKQEPIDGPCGYSWWVVQVEVDEVIKMEQEGGGCGFYGYTPGETIDVLYFAEYVPVGNGDYVEVSGEESMFSCACECCCDGCGLLVRVEVAGSYIRTL